MLIAISVYLLSFILFHILFILDNIFINYMEEFETTLIPSENDCFYILLFSIVPFINSLLTVILFCVFLNVLLANSVVGTLSLLKWAGRNSVNNKLIVAYRKILKYTHGAKDVD